MQDVFEKICNLPLHFSVDNKSALTLAIESGFVDSYKDISKKEIEEYLNRNRHLIDAWQTWSENKRTSEGYFLSIGDDKNSVGFYSSGKIIFSKEFNTDIGACSEFILKELSNILNISS